MTGSGGQVVGVSQYSEYSLDLLCMKSALRYTSVMIWRYINKNGN